MKYTHTHTAFSSFNLEDTQGLGSLTKTNYRKCLHSVPMLLLDALAWIVWFCYFVYGEIRTVSQNQALTRIIHIKSNAQALEIHFETRARYSSWRLVYIKIKLPTIRVARVCFSINKLSFLYGWAQEINRETAARGRQSRQGKNPTKIEQSEAHVRFTFLSPWTVNVQNTHSTLW